MGLARTLAGRSILSRPGRTLFSILGIALGVATVVGVVVLDHNTIIGLSLPSRERGRVDVEIRVPRRQAAEDTRRLYEIEGVSLVARYFQQDATVRRADGDSADAPERVRLLAIDARYAAQLGIYRLAEGSDLPTEGGRQALIGRTLAGKLELEVGDPFWLARPRREGRKVCEDGKLVARGRESEAPTALRFTVAGILAREQVGRRSGGMVVLVDYQAGLALYEGGPRIQPMIWASLDREVDPEQLKPSLAEFGSYDLNPAAILGQAADERAFRMGVRMAGLLALVLGLYVIFHTLSMSLNERMKEVGTLHALGSTRAQIGRVFLSEALLLAGMGSALGLVGGIGLARLLLSLGITTLGTGKDVGIFVVPWGMVLALAGMGFGIALVGSVYPLVSLAGMNTLRVLRGDEHPAEPHGGGGLRLLFALLLALVIPGLYLVIVPVVGRMTPELGMILLGALGALALVVVLSLILPAILSGVCIAITRPFRRLWPMAGLLSARAMRTAPARIGVSIAALSLVTAGFIGLEGMTASLAGEVDHWAEEALHDKVWVRDMPPTRFDAFAAHLHDYGIVLGVEKGGTGIHLPFLVQGVATRELAGYGPCAERPELLRALEEDQGMIVSRRLAQDQDLAVGDHYTITRADGRRETFTIVCVSDAYGHFPDPDERIYALIADHYIEDYFCLDTATVDTVSLRLAPGVGLDEVRSAVEAFHGGPHHIRYRSGEEVHAAHREDIGRDFVLFDILVGLTAVLAGLGVLNGQLLAALERSKESGVLRALGAGQGQLAGMVLLEAFVIGLVGALLGAAIGLGLTPLVIRGLRQLVGLDLPQVSAGPFLWIAIVGCIALALLSAIYPMWRASHADPVRAVRRG